MPPGCEIFPNDVVPPEYAVIHTERYYPWKQPRNSGVEEILQCKPPEYMIMATAYAESGGVETLASGIMGASKMLAEKYPEDAAARTHLLFQFCVSVMCRKRDPRISIEFVRNSRSSARREHVAMVSCVELRGRRPLHARGNLDRLLTECVNLDNQVNDPEDKARPRSHAMEAGVGAQLAGLLADSCVVPEHVLLLVLEPWEKDYDVLPLYASLFNCDQFNTSMILFSKLHQVLKNCPGRKEGFKQAFAEIFNLPARKRFMRRDEAAKLDEMMVWKDLSSHPFYIASVIKKDQGRIITDFVAWLSTFRTEMVDCRFVVPQAPLLGFIAAASLTRNWCSSRAMAMLTSPLRVPWDHFPVDTGVPHVVSDTATAFTVTLANFKYPELLRQPVVLQLVTGDLVPSLIRNMYLGPTPGGFTYQAIRSAFSEMVSSTVSIKLSHTHDSMKNFFGPVLTVPRQKEYNNLCTQLNLPAEIAIPNITDPSFQTPLDLKSLVASAVYDGTAGRPGRPSLATLKALNSVSVDLATAAGSGHVVLDVVHKEMSRIQLLCRMDTTEMAVTPPVALKACVDWIKDQHSDVVSHALTHIGHDPLPDGSVVPPSVLRVPQCRGMSTLESMVLVMNEELVSQGIQYVAAAVLAVLYCGLGANLPVPNALHIALMGPSTCGKSLATDVLNEVAIGGTVERLSTSAMAAHEGTDSSAGMIQVHDELGHAQTGVAGRSRGQKLASDAGNVASQQWLRVLESPFVTHKRTERTENKGLKAKRVVTSTRFACIFTTNMLSLPEAWRKRVMAFYLTRRSLDLSRQYNGVSPECVAIYRLLQARAVLMCQMAAVNLLPETDTTLLSLVLHVYKARLLSCMDAQTTEQDPSAVLEEAPQPVDDSVVGATYTPGQRSDAEVKGSPEAKEEDDDLTRDIELIMSSRHVKAVKAHAALMVTLSRWLFLTGPMKNIFGDAPVQELHAIASFFSVATLGESLSLLVVLMPHSFTDICNPSPLIDEAMFRHIVNFTLMLLRAERILRWRVRCGVGTIRFDNPAGAGAGAGAPQPRATTYQSPVDMVSEVTTEAKFFGAVGVATKLPGFDELLEEIRSGQDTLSPSVANVLQHTPVSMTCDDYRQMLVFAIEVYHACRPALVHASNRNKRMSQNALVTLLVRCTQKTMEVLSTKVHLAQDPLSDDARDLPSLQFYPLAPDASSTKPFMIPPRLNKEAIVNAAYAELLQRIDDESPPGSQSVALSILTDAERVETLDTVPRQVHGPTFGATQRVRKTTKQLLAPVIRATRHICTIEGVKLSTGVINRHWRLAFKSGLEIDHQTGLCTMPLNLDQSVHLSTVALRQTVDVLEKQDNCLQPPGQTQGFLMPPNESQAFGSHSITCERRPNSICRIPPEFCDILKTHSSVTEPTEQGIRETHALVGRRGDNVLDLLYELRGAVEMPVEVTVMSCIRRHVSSWWQAQQNSGRDMSNLPVQHCVELVVSGLKYPWKQTRIYEKLFDKERTVPTFSARFTRPIHPTVDVPVNTGSLKRKNKRKRQYLERYQDSTVGEEDYSNTFQAIAVSHAQNAARIASDVLRDGEEALAARRGDGEDVLMDSHRTRDYATALHEANSRIEQDRMERLMAPAVVMPEAEPVRDRPAPPPICSEGDQKSGARQVTFQDFFQAENMMNSIQCAEPDEDEMEAEEELDVGNQCMDLDEEPPLRVTRAEDLLDVL